MTREPTRRFTGVGKVLVSGEFNKNTMYQCPTSLGNLRQRWNTVLHRPHGYSMEGEWSFRNKNHFDSLSQVVELGLCLVLGSGLGLGKK
jgi:hypothetical protein